MDALKLNIFSLAHIGIVIILLAITPSIQAQSVMSITLPAEITDQIGAGETDSYTFAATAGGVFSFSVRAESDFDPVLTLQDSAGRLVLSNDDYDYPQSRDSLIEAVTVPRTDTYTLSVSGFSGSAGSYVLRVYPGFSQMAANETFETSDGWQAADNLTTAVVDGDYTLEVSGVRAWGASFYQYVDPATDIYVQTQVMSIDNANGWIIGLAMRQTRASYYMLSINNEGLWRFSSVEDNTMQVIRDWTPHPQIVAGQTEFTLGMIGNAASFDFYYNNGFIGSISDDSLTLPGSIGVVIGTTSSLSSTTRARIDNLIVTTPRFIDNARVIPQHVIVSSGAEMERTLEVRHVVDATGTMALTVPASSVEFARSGVNRLMLGRGTTYSNFALGAFVDIQGAQQGLAGCGLVIRYAGEGDYVLAYLDQSGGYGLSQRDGDVFLPGRYGENPEWGEDRVHLLIIADDSTLYYYIEGQFVGSLETSAANGEIGTAVVNFETITTTCQYSDLWLWQWE